MEAIIDQKTHCWAHGCKSWVPQARGQLSFFVAQRLEAPLGPYEQNWREILDENLQQPQPKPSAYPSPMDKPSSQTPNLSSSLDAETPKLDYQVLEADPTVDELPNGVSH